MLDVPPQPKTLQETARRQLIFSRRITAVGVQLSVASQERGFSTDSLDKLLEDPIRAEFRLRRSASVTINKLRMFTTPATKAELNDTEQNIVDAVGSDCLTGEQIAKRTGYPYNSNFKATLSSLHKRGILENMKPGYVLPTRKPNRKSGQSQD
jgi:hypothetical protein